MYLIKRERGNCVLTVLAVDDCKSLYSNVSFLVGMIFVKELMNLVKH